MKKLGILLAVLVLPIFVYAQTADSILVTVEDILNALIPIIITLGVIYFMWGVIQYTTGKSDDAKKEGRDRMIFGIIGLFVIVSIWGLVNLVSTTFDIEQGGINDLPYVTGK